MDKIVNKYFSTKIIDTLERELNKFKIELKKGVETSSVSKSLKIHAVLDHLTNCLAVLN